MFVNVCHVAYLHFWHLFFSFHDARRRRFQAQADTAQIVLTLSLQQSVECQPHRWIRKGSANQKSATKRCCQIHGTVAAPWIHNVGFANSPATETFANTGTECWSHGWSHWRIRTDRYPNLQRFFETGELTSLGLKIWCRSWSWQLMGPFSAGSTRALEEGEVWTVIRIHNVGYTSPTGRDLKLLKCEPDSDNP